MTWEKKEGYQREESKGAPAFSVNLLLRSSWGTFMGGMLSNEVFGERYRLFSAVHESELHIQPYQ